MPSRDQPALYAAAAQTTLGMWRYRDLLPPCAAVTLGEGWTPLLGSRRHPGLYLKDESRNPHATVADRGFALATALARREAVENIAPTSPAAEAYAAAAGIAPGTALSPAHILEGEMTLGYELCEHFQWQPPDAIFCPATLVPALSSAFDKLASLQRLASATRPHFYAETPVTRAQTTAALHAFAHHEGLLLSPEAAAAYAAYLQFAPELPPNSRTVLINPTQGRPPIQLPTSMPVGGIITPV